MRRSVVGLARPQGYRKPGKVHRPGKHPADTACGRPARRLTWRVDITTVPPDKRCGHCWPLAPQSQEDA